MRRPARLELGTLPFDLLPDGRPIAAPPPTELPFGAAVQATVLYPSLRAFLAAFARRSVGAAPVGRRV